VDLALELQNMNCLRCLRNVSILVLVDLALECYYEEIRRLRMVKVSILVLVDLALESFSIQLFLLHTSVSILVLVDLALE